VERLAPTSYFCRRLWFGATCGCWPHSTSIFVSARDTPLAQGITCLLFFVVAHVKLLEGSTAGVELEFKLLATAFAPLASRHGRGQGLCTVGCASSGA